MSFEIDIWHDDTLTIKQVEDLNKLHEEYLEKYKQRVNEAIKELRATCEAGSERDTTLTDLERKLGLG